MKKLLEEAGAEDVKTFSLVRWGKNLQKKNESVIMKSEKQKCLERRYSYD